MFILLAKQLSFLKKQVNLKKKKTFTYLISSVTILTVLVILFEYFFDWNFIFNTIRCLLAIILGILIFGLTYSISYEKSKKEPFKIVTIIKTFYISLSHNQRVNLSILLVGITVIITMLLTLSPAPIKTLVMSILIAFWIGLILFITPTYNEIINNKEGLVDNRDLQFNIKENKDKEKIKENDRRKNN